MSAGLYNKNGCYRRVIFWVIYSVIVSFEVGLAHAGPWLQAKGANFIHIAHSKEQFNAVIWDRYSLYFERGLSTRTTLSGQIEWVKAPISNFNREGVRLMARRQWLNSGQWVGNMEVGAVYGDALGGIGMCSSLGVEGRVGLGKSGDLRGIKYYTALEIAERVYSDGCQRTRLEFTLGHEIQRNLYLIGQVWIDEGSGTPSNKYDIAYQFHIRNIGLSLGYRREFSGAFNEEAIVYAISGKF